MSAFWPPEIESARALSERQPPDQHEQAEEMKPSTSRRVRAQRRSVRQEAEHLEEVFEEGDSAEAASIAIGGVAVVVISVFLTILAVALAAYYLA
jgi:ABC-type glycerol-3-phosphate transport system permease component